jgi:hypothetical protein
MLKKGRGPKIIRVSSRIRITANADLEWVKKREAEDNLAADVAA